MKKTRYVVTNGCTFCGTCAAECPAQAVTIGPKGARIDQEKCTACGHCHRNCASEAIQKFEVEKEA
jgi:uncharacterized Fe-S center protein